MPSTRIGKIGRLPKSIRDEINHRLENGHIGVHIVAWLNQQETGQEILKENFDGRPINEQNLSDWKNGGYIDWLRHRDAESLAKILVERSDALEQASEGRPLADRFANLMAMEFTRLAEDLLDQDADPAERWKRLSQIHREFSRLRRDDHQAIRTSVCRQRWERQVEAEDAAAEKNDQAKRHHDLATSVQARLGLEEIAESLGNTGAAWNLAALIQEADYGLDLGHLGRDCWHTPIPGFEKSTPAQTPPPDQPLPSAENQTQSNPSKG